MRIPSQPASHVPEWALRSVFYHIYPLGFLDAPLTNPGGEPVPRLAALTGWLDHFDGLGVNAFYFGPIFESGSHGYDTTDYFRVDRRLGTNATFQEVLDAFHERGFRVILDGVFNHTGRDFFAFADIRQNGRDSRYHNWYHINWGGESAYDDGFAYQSWQGHQMLPELDLANAEVRAYLFEAVQMWLADVGIDGWRLDVAHELPVEFLWELRRVVREARPDAFLLGEVDRGDYRKWVAPDLLDSGTNYQLHKPLARAFNDANLHDLKASMERAWHSEWGLYREIPLVNFLANHDVTRALSSFDDPRNIYPALIALLTMPGIPMLYYGDEIGMTARKEQGDQALRQPMPAPGQPWPDADGDLYREIARLVRIRRDHPALLYGRFSALDVSDTTYAYLRQHTRETAVVVLNADTESRAVLNLAVAAEGLRDGTTFRDALDPAYPVTVASGSLAVDAPPGWGRILIAAT